MKRFLLRIVLLLVMCLCVLLALSRLYLVFVSTDYLRYRDETLKFKSVPYQIEYAVFGSSHSGASFQPDAVPGHTMFNFFMAAQSPIMDAELCKLFQDHFAEHATVVLTISPTSLYYDPTDDMTHMKRYCNELPLKALPTAKTKLYRLFRVIDFRVDDVLEYFRTRSITDFSAAETNDILTGLVTNDEKSNLDWTEWGMTLAAIHKDLISPDFTAGPQPRVADALDKMLSDCVERGYRVALYTPPFTEYYWNNFSEEFQAQMRRDAAAIAEKNHVAYFDYSEDARFCSNMDYFGDVDHMSFSGSKALVPVLLADIEAFYAE